MSKPRAHSRDAYPYGLTLATRWNDNDLYGHINNTVYYEFFDTIVNRFLIKNALLVLGKSETIGLVVETGCSYFAPIAFPNPVEARLRVAKLGTSSVRYDIGVFSEGRDTACAQGHLVHVYVDALTHRPTPLRPKMREILQEYVR